MADDTPLKAYRASLQTLMEKMQAEYDKTVIILSGGAIGLSITFSKELIGRENLRGPNWLLLALLSWSLSVGLMLASFFTSAQAMERAIRQTDQHAVYREPVGGFFDKMTRHLNAVAGMLFFTGLVFITVFIRSNLK